MKRKTSVVGTIYKEALGIVGLDGVLEELGLTSASVRAHLLTPVTNHLSHFEFTNQKVISYVRENQIALMMRGIQTEIVVKEEVEVGDTVKLKSGGPIMSVRAVNAEAETADLIRFDPNVCEVMNVFSIPFACLVPADPPA